MIGDGGIAAVTQKDCRGLATAEESAWLRQPENIAAWRAAIVATLQDVDARLSSRAADLQALKQECMREGAPGKDRYFQAETEYRQWKSRAMWFRGHVVNRLQETKVRAREIHAEVMASKAASRQQDGDLSQRVADVILKAFASEQSAEEAAHSAAAGIVRMMRREDEAGSTPRR